MQYDPIKSALGRFFNRHLWLRILFYRLLHVLLLRSWHIRGALRNYSRAQKSSQPLSALDAGSGFGQYVWLMARNNPAWDVTGIDLKEEQVEDCNQFFQKAGYSKVHFEQADLTAFSHPQKYDLILSVDVMEHIEDDEGVFKNFYTSLKDQGVLLISTPSDQGGSDAHHDHDTSFIEEHVRNGYGREDITAKLTRAGFANIEVSYTYGTPGRLSWLLSMKYPILLLGVSRWFFLVLWIYYIITFPLCLVLNFFDVRMQHATGTGLMVIAQKRQEVYRTI